jgi:hypothetical protein
MRWIGDCERKGTVAGRQVRFLLGAPRFVVIRVKKARIIRKARFNVSSILSVQVRSAKRVFGLKVFMDAH